MNNMAVGMAFMIMGLVLDFVGCLGLIRFPDVYNRLQAAVKCVTLGTGVILFGLFVIKGFSATGVKALLCMAFIFLTAPVSAHALARGAYKSGMKPYSGTVADQYADEK